jgi:rhomboid family GlyGly-CTERM serine protease
LKLEAWLGRPGAAWFTGSLLLAAGALLAWWLPGAWLDWQPALAISQPWRWWTAAFVHWSAGHLAANLGAAIVVGAFGLAARVPWSFTLAWLAAWPLTHGLLWLQPRLLHYGGLSGVLHAGVAVALVFLLARGERRQRGIAALVTAGLLVKLWLEAPWGEPLRHSAGWDIALAPIGHATGALAGALCALAALAAGHRKAP